MEHLQWRGYQPQRICEIVLWAKARGLQTRPSGFSAGTPDNPRTGRRNRGQHVYEVVPLFLRAIRLRRCAGDSTGDRSLPKLVLVQHLRDLVVAASHASSFVDLLRKETFQEDFRRDGC